MRRFSAALCMWGVLGCAAAPPALPAATLLEPPLQVVAPPQVVPTSTASTPGPARARRVAEVLPALAPPSERACSLSSSKWSGELQLGPGKAVYGSINHGPVKLSLGSETRDGSAFAEAGNGALELLGTIDQPEIFSRALITLASFVTPLAATPLAWQPTGEVGRVGVTLDISDVFAVPGVVEKVVPCDKLTIDAPSYDASVVAAGATSTGLIGGGVDLFLTPGTPPIARTKERNYEQALVLERRGRHTRVAIRTLRYYAVGWVANEAVGSSGADGIGSMGGLGLANGGMSTRSCRHDLELVAEVASARQVVGWLRAGGQYRASTLDVAEGFTALSVFTSWFSLAPGAKLLVRTKDLAGC